MISPKALVASRRATTNPSGLIPRMLIAWIIIAGFSEVAIAGADGAERQSISPPSCGNAVRVLDRGSMPKFGRDGKKEGPDDLMLWGFDSQTKEVRCPCLGTA
jgi:hypothetical protein